jgi:hypothetical protein
MSNRLPINCHNIVAQKKEVVSGLNCVGGGSCSDFLHKKIWMVVVVVQTFLKFYVLFSAF